MAPRRLLSHHCAGPTNLSALALWCQRFTPFTAPDPPDGVLQDITGCTHLFGGEAGLVAALAARLPGRRYRRRLGAGALWRSRERRYFSSAFGGTAPGEVAGRLIPAGGKTLRPPSRHHA